MLNRGKVSVQNQHGIFAQSIESLGDISFFTPPPSLQVEADSAWKFEDAQNDERGEASARSVSLTPTPTPPSARSAARRVSAGGVESAMAAGVFAHAQVSGRSQWATRECGEALPAALSLKDLMTQSVVCLDALGDAPTLEDVVTGPDDPAGCANLMCSFDASRLPPEGAATGEARTRSAAPRGESQMASRSSPAREASARERRQSGEGPLAEAQATAEAETTLPTGETPDAGGACAGEGQKDGRSGESTQAKPRDRK